MNAEATGIKTTSKNFLTISPTFAPSRGVGVQVDHAARRLGRRRQGDAREQGADHGAEGAKLRHRRALIYVQVVDWLSH